MLRLNASLAAIASIALSLLASTALAAQEGDTEAKASFLVRFAAFVAWPTEAFISNSDPLTICVSGADPFGTVLDKAAQGQSAEGREIEVRHLGAGASTGCQIVYVGKGPGLTPAAIHNLQAGPILVVTDETNGEVRGAIHFVAAEERIRFHVDLGQTPRGVMIDSRLLSQALSVEGGT